MAGKQYRCIIAISGLRQTGSRHEGRVTNPALRPTTPTTTTTRSPRIPGKPEIPTKTPTKKPVHPPKPHPRPPHGGRKPSTCDTSYDAISIIRRELFIFKDRVSLDYYKSFCLKLFTK